MTKLEEHINDKRKHWTDRDIAVFYTIIIISFVSLGGLITLSYQINNSKSLCELGLMGWQEAWTGEWQVMHNVTCFEVINNSSKMTSEYIGDKEAICVYSENDPPCYCASNPFPVKVMHQVCPSGVKVVVIG